MVDTLFSDVSEFQPHADVSAIRRQTGAIAARVSYGTRLDKMMPARVVDIREQGFVVVLFLEQILRYPNESDLGFMPMKQRIGVPFESRSGKSRPTHGLSN
jgi:hypothetical protein